MILCHQVSTENESVTLLTQFSSNIVSNQEKKALENRKTNSDFSSLSLIILLGWLPNTLANLAIVGCKITPFKLKGNF